MLHLTGEASILRIKLLREIDFSLKIFSKEYGFFTVYAFGGAKSKKRFIGCLDIFNRIEYVLLPSKSKDYISLQEAKLLQGTQELRKKVEFYGMLQNCSSFLEISYPVLGLNNIAIYTLFTSLLDVFESTEKLSPFFPLYFRIKLTMMLGYMPVVDSCLVCKTLLSEIKTPYFSVEKGGLLCSFCKEDSSAIKLLSKETLFFLEYIRYTNPFDWITMFFSLQSKQECFALMEDFILYHLGISWEKGYFKRLT
ncbi:MAG: DNA repair protein RecO [Desulfovibrionaceae bacterium]